MYLYNTWRNWSIYRNKLYGGYLVRVFVYIFTQSFAMSRLTLGKSLLQCIRADILWITFQTIHFVSHKNLEDDWNRNLNEQWKIKVIILSARARLRLTLHNILGAWHLKSWPFWFTLFKYNPIQIVLKTMIWFHKTSFKKNRNILNKSHTFVNLLYFFFLNCRTNMFSPLMLWITFT